jgi:hypothetical protein
MVGKETVTSAKETRAVRAFSMSIVDAAAKAPGTSRESRETDILLKSMKLVVDNLDHLSPKSGGKKSEQNMLSASNVDAM